jgi:hypothetical protein
MDAAARGLPDDENAGTRAGLNDRAQTVQARAFAKVPASCSDALLSVIR